MRVPPGASICPSCDYIVDDSFLSAEPPEPDDEPTPAGPAPAGWSPEPRTQIGASRPAPAPTPSVAAASIRPPPEEFFEDPAPEDLSFQSSFADSSGAMDPAVAIREARTFWQDLSRSDQWAVAGSAGIIASTLFPWKETAAEGDVVGLMSSGLLALVVAGLVVGTVVLRVQQTLPRLPPVVPWMCQLAGIGFCMLWSLLAIKLSWSNEEVKSALGTTISVSRPSIGVFFAVGASAAALFGTLRGLGDRVR